MTLLDAALMAMKFMEDRLAQPCGCAAGLPHIPQCERPLLVETADAIHDAVYDAQDKHLHKTHTDPEDDKCELAWDLHCARHHKREKELQEKWKGVLAMMELVAAAHPCNNPHCSCREIRAKVDKALDIRAQADAKLKEKNP